MRRAFTLIELLVVISIISLLSSVVLSSLNTARSKARDAQRQSDIQEVNKAIHLYWLDNNTYPSTGSLNNVLMDPGCITANGTNDQITADWVPGLVSGGYISVLPRDPRPKDVVYGYGGGGACYMYGSNGATYILTAWATVENTPVPKGLYSRVGYRQPSWNVSDATVYCDYFTAQGLYDHTYTISNHSCSW